jgi:hypothetical protein
VPIGSLDVGSGVVLPSGASAERNVGVRMSSLTRYDGDYVLSSGEQVSGLDIHGRVTTSGPLAAAPKVTDCIVRGVGGATSQSGMVLGHSFDMSGTVFEWCTFDATGNESPWLDGLSGGNFTVRYSEILRGVDGIHLTQGNVTAECCRIYHGHYWAFWDDTANAKRTASFTDYAGRLWTPPFPSRSSGDVHSDGIQIAGSSGNVIRGCYIGGEDPIGLDTSNLDPTKSADYAAIQAYDQAVGYKNSALIVNALASNPIGALVEKNWFHGGAARVNLSTNGTDLLAGLTLRDNRFVRSSYGFYLYAQIGNAATISGNVYDDDGSAVPVVNW